MDAKTHPIATAAASEGNQWFDPAELWYALDVFETLYTDHLLLEESIAYPHAKQPRRAGRREPLVALALITPEC